MHLSCLVTSVRDRKKYFVEWYDYFSLQGQLIFNMAQSYVKSKPMILKKSLDKDCVTHQHYLDGIPPTQLSWDLSYNYVKPQ